MRVFDVTNEISDVVGGIQKRFKAKQNKANT